MNGKLNANFTSIPQPHFHLSRIITASKVLDYGLLRGSQLWFWTATGLQSFASTLALTGQ